MAGQLPGSRKEGNAIMESLLGKVQAQSQENTTPPDAATPSADSGPSMAGLLGAAPDEAHAQLQQAATQLSPDQFQGATSSALSGLSTEAKTALSQALAGTGAAQGAGVAASADDAASLSKMMHWVQTNVPGGIPGVLATLGVAGGAAAIAGTGQTGNVAGQVEDAGGGLFHSVLGAIMPAITNAVSKVGK